MPLPGDRRADLLKLLRTRDYRQGYFEDFYNTRLAAQIRTLRESRDLSQQQLAKVIETGQSVISKLEDVSYSGWSVRMLRRLARVFDVILQVRFVTYGEALADIEEFSHATLAKPPYEEDAVLHAGPAHTISVSTAVAGASVIPVQMGKALVGSTMLRTTLAGSFLMQYNASAVQTNIGAEPKQIANDNLAKAS